MLVDIAEGVQETGCPGISSASGIGCLGNPERLAGFEPVAQTGIERVDPVRARQPFFGKSRGRRCSQARTSARASLRNRCVEVIREDVVHRSGRLEQVLRANYAAVQRNGRGTTFRYGTWAEEQNVGRSLLQKRTEDGDIPGVRGSIIALRRSPDPCQIGLVHKFGSG